MFNFGNFLSSNFWANYRAAESEKIKELLESNECSVEKLMDEADFLQELKYSNAKLMRYLDHDKLLQLLDYIIVMPEEDSHDRGHKYPFTAAEVFGTESPSILDKFFEAPAKPESEELKDEEETAVQDNEQPESGEKKSEEDEENREEVKKAEEEKKEEGQEKDGEGTVSNSQEPSEAVQQQDQKDSDEAAEISQQANLMRDMIKKEAQEPEDEPVINEPAAEDIEDPANVANETNVKKEDEANRYMLLDKLFLFIRSKEDDDLNPVLSGYFSKIVRILITKRQKQIVPYLFDTFSDVIDCLLRHSYQKSISEVLYKILTEVESADYDQPLAGQIDFYQSTILKSLVSDLAPDKAEEANLNALAVIQELIGQPKVQAIPSFLGQQQAEQRKMEKKMFNNLCKQNSLAQLVDFALRGYAEGQRSSKTSSLTILNIILKNLIDRTSKGQNDPEKHEIHVNSDGEEDKQSDQDEAAKEQKEQDENLAKEQIGLMTDLLQSKMMNIQNVLRPDHQGERVVDSVDTQTPHVPLGLQRLLTVELLHKILLLRNPDIELEISESQVLSNIVQLAKQYRWNNFLQLVCIKIFNFILESVDDPTMQVKMLSQSQIGPYLVDMSTLERYQMESGNEIRNGFMAFVIKVANWLQDKYTLQKERLTDDDDDQEEIHRENLIVQYIESIADWQDFVDGELKYQNLKNNRVLGQGLFGVNSRIDQENAIKADQNMFDQDEIDKQFDSITSTYEYHVGKRQQAGLQVIEQPNSRDEAHFLPLKQINAEVSIQDSLAIIKMKQQYQSPKEKEQSDKKLSKIANLLNLNNNTKSFQSDDSNGPMEVTFKFPKLPNSLISKVDITVNGISITGEIMSNDLAQQKYDDAIAAGNAAAQVKESVINNEEIELIEVDIGNIQKGSTAIVEIHIIQQLNMVSGAFNFVLPLSYFPKCKIPITEPKSEDEELSHDDADIQPNFNLNLTINSQNQISHLSHPPSLKILEQSANCLKIKGQQQRFADMKKDISIFYRCMGMDAPKFFYQRCSKYKDEVAVMAQFLPTFEAADSPDSKLLVQADGEELEEADCDENLEENVSQFCFYFVIDRSGSMEGSRIDIAKQSLKLFVQSLPNGCKFHIISFGSSFKYLKQQEPFDYNDANLRYCKDEIDKFSADFGGTEIFEPLQSVFENGSDTKRRIFLLTDGDVFSQEKLIKLIENNCQSDGLNKVFTFGIGSGASRELVIDSARAGKGDYSFVADANLGTLRAKVIDMLQKATEPVLVDCSFTFLPNLPDSGTGLFRPARKQEIGQIFRNSLVHQFTVMSEEQFNDLECVFECQNDPQTQKPLVQKFFKDKFVDFSHSLEREDGDGDEDQDSHLFKLAARHEMDSMSSGEDNIVEISTRYQVLSKETSLIGIIRQNTKTDKQMENFAIQGKEEEDDDDWQGGEVDVESLQNSLYIKAHQRAQPPSIFRDSGANFNKGATESAPDESIVCSISTGQVEGMFVNFNQIVNQGEAAGDDEDEDENDGTEAVKCKADDNADDAANSGPFKPAEEGEEEDEHSDTVKGEQPSSFEESKDADKIEEAGNLHQNLADGQEDHEAQENEIIQQNEMMSSEAQDQQATSEEEIDSSSNPFASFPSEPNYDNLINFQSSEGFWPCESEEMILGFLSQDNRETLNQIENSFHNNPNMIRLMMTLLAIGTLQTQFSSKRDEWKMIGKKANKWLKSARQNILSAESEEDQIAMQQAFDKVSCLAYQSK